MSVDVLRARARAGARFSPGDRLDAAARDVQDVREYLLRATNPVRQHPHCAPRRQHPQIHAGALEGSLESPSIAQRAKQVIVHALNRVEAQAAEPVFQEEQAG